MPRPLGERRCSPRRPGARPMPISRARRLLKQIPGWTLIESQPGGRLKRVFRFPDFARALGFVVAVGALAESEGHHPDVTLTWGRVEITLWTHDVGGLSESDFVVAAKINGWRPAPSRPQIEK
ncbi:MAG: 4a-hydroxytetrahydrobiopterin dehydratase [Planctomycetes bacterium]|nr:4a-hydroxytetrahydrobiopterin dehydratase [Planctomycetota bacterium]